MVKIPNWADAKVIVVGRTKKDVEDFCKYFIMDEDEEGERQKPYFARSFTHESWKDFKTEYIDGLTAVFGVDFAWSAHSCLISGYPDDKECITLVKAAKKHKVYVTIDTSEPGMAFEEHIECNEKGVLVIEECNDMPSYTCKCGNTHSIPSNWDTSEEECCECGETGEWKLEVVKDG